MVDYNINILVNYCDSSQIVAIDMQKELDKLAAFQSWIQYFILFLFFLFLHLPRVSMFHLHVIVMQLAHHKVVLYIHVMLWDIWQWCRERMYA